MHELASLTSERRLMPELEGQIAHGSFLRAHGPHSHTLHGHAPHNLQPKPQLSQ